MLLLFIFVCCFFLSAKKVRARWVGLRDSFKKKEQEQKAASGVGADETPEPQWDYWKAMSFMARKGHARQDSCKFFFWA